MTETPDESRAEVGLARSEDREADITSPANVMRIGTMVKQLLEEVRSTELDEKGRERLAEIHRRSIEELEEGLSAELIDELECLDLPFDSQDGPPTTSELRSAQAQLVGWLGGRFHGIQTALTAPQAMAPQPAVAGQPPPARARTPPRGGGSYGPSHGIPTAVLAQQAVAQLLPGSGRLPPGAVVPPPGAESQSSQTSASERDDSGTGNYL